MWFKWSKMPKLKLWISITSESNDPQNNGEGVQPVVDANPTSEVSDQNAHQILPWLNQLLILDEIVSYAGYALEAGTGHSPADGDTAYDIYLKNIWTVMRLTDRYYTKVASLAEDFRSTLEQAELYLKAARDCSPGVISQQLRDVLEETMSTFFDEVEERAQRLWTSGHEALKEIDCLHVAWPGVDALRQRWLTDLKPETSSTHDQPASSGQVPKSVYEQKLDLLAKHERYEEKFEQLQRPCLKAAFATLQDTQKTLRTLESDVQLSRLAIEGELKHGGRSNALLLISELEQHAHNLRRASSNMASAMTTERKRRYELEQRFDLIISTGSL